ncbi:uncharacterized protein Dwil_GK27020 [Drosophila willistoni]|uniref:Fibrinogen C-terminal domain-containing protein n=1 Tax=Drosophila willistoni TaxID=7260 RepID=A0A0Q9WYY8_DROWI|nr:microfibril-associated glycoprotein 4 [Drosophila willistoni]KRF98376.1 uncharacterized protein Dwil_GK27020 [Drosophila willistoni]
MRNLFVLITIYLLFQRINATEISDDDDAVETNLTPDQCVENYYNVVIPLLSKIVKLNIQLDAYEETFVQFGNVLDAVESLIIANSKSVEDSLATKGWTVIQRRLNGNVSFDRNWNDYKHGFGDSQGDFFIGLEKLHMMTQARPHELYIELRDVKGITRYARYDDFNVGSEENSYNLTSLGAYVGTAGDSLSENVGAKFSTRDRDNSEGDEDCTSDGSGGWWYTYCGDSQLNGIFYKDGDAPERNGIGWDSWDNLNYNVSLIYTHMMIRPTI